MDAKNDLETITKTAAARLVLRNFGMGLVAEVVTFAAGTYLTVLAWLDLTKELTKHSTDQYPLFAATAAICFLSFVQHFPDLVSIISEYRANPQEYVSRYFGKKLVA